MEVINIMQTTVNEILKDISLLSAEDQYFIIETLNKRRNDLRRKQISLRAKDAQKNYDKGNVKSGTVADLMDALKEND